jgi:hypothetical protein
MRQLRMAMAAMTLLTAHQASAQTVLAPTVQVPTGAALPGPGQHVLLFAPQPDGGSVTVIQEEPSLILGNPIRVVVSGSGNTKSYSIANALPHTIGILKSQVLYLRKSNSGVEHRVLNIETGRESALNLELTPQIVASQQGKVLMLGKVGNIVTFGLLDSDLKIGLYPSPALAAVALNRCILSFASSNQALLVDRTDASYWPIELGSTVTVGARVQLSGSEIDLSRQKAEVSKQQVKTVTTFRPHMILAHLKARNGNDLFFLGPYNGRDGFRVAEFNRQGQQTQTYRLTAPGVSSGALTLRESAVAATSARIEVVSLDGTQRSYERP